MMKIFVAVLCVFAAIVAADENFVVTADSEKDLTPVMWNNQSATTIFIDSGSQVGKYEVRLVRRNYFAKNDSAVWLCPTVAPCAHSGTNNTDYKQSVILALGYKHPMLVQFTGSDFDDMVDITVKVCKEKCEDECPGDCHNHGGCFSGIDRCICDVDYHDKGDDCFSSGLDWYYILVIIGVGCLVFLLLVVAIIICLCCCCCCACCKD